LERDNRQGKSGLEVGIGNRDTEGKERAKKTLELS
jgi:hypothetical protein